MKKPTDTLPRLTAAEASPDAVAQAREIVKSAMGDAKITRVMAIGTSRDSIQSSLYDALIKRIAAVIKPANWEWHHEHDAALIRRDGMMCEHHPGVEFPHDGCAGPGQAWCIEGREAVVAAISGGTKK